MNAESAENAAMQHAPARMVDVDWLTGLPGRGHLLRQLHEAIGECAGHGRRAAFLVLGLDNFKQINNSRDHALGDEILINVAKRLRYLVNDFGLVGKFDGDKFAIFLAGLSPERMAASSQARRIANFLRLALSSGTPAGGENHKLSCSIGVYVFGANTGDPQQIFKCAECAMYDAKSGGRNQVRIFDPAALRDIEHRAILARDLRVAIDDADLQLRYQPQINRKGRITGAEALIRWRHPQFGDIKPDIFVRIAEESGLIVPMTDWVLEQALDTLLRWQRHPGLRELSLSVNISAQQFHQEEFLKKLRYFARHYRIELSGLVLELT